MHIEDRPAPVRNVAGSLRRQPRSSRRRAKCSLDKSASIDHWKITSFLERPQFDIPKFDPVVLLALKPDQSRGVCRIVSVQQRLTIQHDDKVVALRRNVVTVPLIWQDFGG